MRGLRLLGRVTFGETLTEYCERWYEIAWAWIIRTKPQSTTGGGMSFPARVILGTIAGYYQ